MKSETRLPQFHTMSKEVPPPFFWKGQYLVVLFDTSLYKFCKHYAFGKEVFFVCKVVIICVWHALTQNSLLKKTFMQQMFAPKSYVWNQYKLINSFVNYPKSTLKLIHKVVQKLCIIHAQIIHKFPMFVNKLYTKYLSHTRSCVQFVHKRRASKALFYKNISHQKIWQRRNPKMSKTACLFKWCLVNQCWPVTTYLTGILF